MVRAWQLGAGPGTDPVVIDLDSTICEVHGKEGAAYGYTKAGLSPAVHPCRYRSCSRMRKGSAGSSRGVVRFVDELVARLKRAGATGAKTVRADSGFWSWKLMPQPPQHRRSPFMPLYAKPSARTTPRIDYTIGSTPKSPKPPMSPAATTPNDPNDQSGSSCDGLGSPKVPNTNYGLIGVTTPSSPTGPTSTVPQPTGSTVNTPPLNSPSVTSKKAPGSTTSHQDTTQRTVPGSRVPCSPTTSAPGPPTSPISHQSQTGPDAPNSPPSPLSPSTGADNQPYGSQLAGPGPTNSTRHSAPCEHFPAPQADTSHQDLTHPRQARRRQPTHDPPTAGTTVLNPNNVHQSTNGGSRLHDRAGTMLDS